MRLYKRASSDWMELVRKPAAAKVVALAEVRGSGESAVDSSLREERGSLEIARRAPRVARCA